MFRVTSIKPEDNPFSGSQVWEISYAGNVIAWFFDMKNADIAADALDKYYEYSDE